MFERLTLKEAANLASGDPSGFLGGLLAGARNVRRHHDVRSCQEARIRRDRLFRKHVEAGAPKDGCCRARRKRRRNRQVSRAHS